MRKPDFFVVGAAKAGTTSIWRYCNKHPNLFLTKDVRYKELSFYTSYFGMKSESVYLNFFKEAGSEQLIGEVCNVYLTAPDSARLIKEANPNAKIIIVLRNPAHRAFSLYSWMVYNGSEWISDFESALEEEKKRKDQKGFQKNSGQYLQNFMYFGSGCYYGQVKRYLETFGQSSCYITSYEAFSENPKNVMKEIFTFLGVNSSLAIFDKSYNTGKFPKNVRLHYFLKRRLPYELKKKRIYNSFFQQIIDFLVKINTSPIKPSLSKETEKNLLKNYKEDINKLSELTGKDFTFWLK